MASSPNTILHHPLVLGAWYEFLVHPYMEWIVGTMAFFFAVFTYITVLGSYEAALWILYGI